MAETIAELAASLGIDLDKTSVKAAENAINAVKVRLEEMALKADLAGKLTAKALNTISLGALKAEENLKKAKDKDPFAWFKKGFAALAGLHISEHLFEMGEQAISTGAKMKDLSEKTGVSTDTIQELGYAAEMNGTSTQFMANTLAKLSVSLDQAASGGEGAAQAFKNAGIAVKDAEGKTRPAVDVLGDIADYMKGLSEEERPAKAFELLGRQGKELIPLLKDGREGMQKWKDEAHEFGLVMDGETLEAMDKVEKNSQRLRKAWEGIKQRAIAALIPEIEKLTNKLLEWYKANKSDIAIAVQQAFHLILITVKLLAGVLMRLIKIVAFVARAWKAMTVILISAAAAYAILHAGSIKAGWAMFKAGLQAAKGWVVALAPILAIAAAIAGLILLIQDIFVWLKGGKSVMGQLFGKPEDSAFGRGIKKVFQVVVDIVKWIVDKVTWLLGKATKAYDYIVHGEQYDRAGKAARNELAERDRLGRITEQRQAVLERLRSNPNDPIARVRMAGLNQQYNASVDRLHAYEAEGTKALQQTNYYEIHGGDPEKVRQVIEETNARDLRQAAATVGGGKKKR